jgi:hypothetical protein
MGAPEHVRRLGAISSRATLIYVVKRNLTISVPDELLRRVKVVAAERETSISALVADSLTRLVERSNDPDYRRSRQELLDSLRRGRDLGLKGEIPWTRDELNER